MQFSIAVGSKHDQESERKKKSEREIGKFDFKLPNGDAVTRKEKQFICEGKRVNMS